MIHRPKVLFVNPPIRLHREEFEYLVHWPRHAIVMAAELQAQFDVRILDVTAEFHADSRWQDCAVETGLAPGKASPLAGPLRDIVISSIADFRPDVCLVHAHAAPHIPIVKLTFDAIIESISCLPEMIVGVGGMAATHLTQTVADWAPEGSWIIRGEGTGRICDVLELMLGNRQPDISREFVRTISGQRTAVLQERVFRGEVEQVPIPQPATTSTVVDINFNETVMDYPRPRMDLLRMDVYSRLYQDCPASAAERGFVPHLEMSSGCTYRCKFCGVHYHSADEKIKGDDMRLRIPGRFRTRPVPRVVDEMKHLRERYGFEEFYFCDETFTLLEKHTRELCEAMISELPGIRWRCVTRVDHIERPMAELMFRAGCHEIGFGVEVGSDDILQYNTKDSSVNQNISKIQMVQDVGIDANALTIIGMPQEDHGDIRRTFEFLAKAARPNRCQIFVFHPVPGTEYFLHPELHGLKFDTRNIDEWYKWDHIGEPVCDTRFLSCEDIARYFMLFNRALPTIVDPQVDAELQARILENRFPVRRRGVSWFFEPDCLRLYKATDASRCISDNAFDLQAADLGPEGIRAAEYVLSRSNGLLTEDEIALELSRIQNLSELDSRRWTARVLEVFSSAAVDVVTFF